MFCVLTSRATRRVYATTSVDLMRLQAQLYEDKQQHRPQALSGTCCQRGKADKQCRLFEVLVQTRGARYTHLLLLLRLCLLASSPVPVAPNLAWFIRRVTSSCRARTPLADRAGASAVPPVRGPAAVQWNHSAMACCCQDEQPH